MGLPFWEASALLPAFVVTDIAVGAGLAVCGIAFASGFSLADRVLTLCWPLFVLYGAWVFHNGHSIMSNWTGIFEGDLVTLGAISGIGYVLIGLVLFATRMLQAPR